jgi:predicted NodU family carbamoyl transferase
VSCRLETHEIEHHLVHVATSFYCSGFKEAAALLYNASGDFVSTMFALCTPNGIEILDRVFLPDSLGYFYTAICQFIGSTSSAALRTIAELPPETLEAMGTQAQALLHERFDSRASRARVCEIIEGGRSGLR